MTGQPVSPAPSTRSAAGAAGVSLIADRELAGERRYGDVRRDVRRQDAARGVVQGDDLGRQGGDAPLQELEHGGHLGAFAEAAHSHVAGHACFRGLLIPCRRHVGQVANLTSLAAPAMSP